MAYDTVKTVINDAAVELGLPSSSSPMGSSDPNMIMLCSLLKAAGRELVYSKDWTHLVKEHTFVTVQGTSTYALPSDFHNMISQTGWVRTTRLPLGGPLSPQEWQFLKARLVGVVFSVLFRPLQGQIHIYPDTNTPGDQTIAFEYISNAWIAPVATPTVPSLDAPANDDDVVFFQSFLMSRMLKLWFLRAKGFDTTAAQQDYDRAYDMVASVDSQSPVMNLSEKRIKFQILDARNIPVTGFGS